jgi:hypothetical protein
LTLVIVPAVFTLFDDIERWIAPKAGKLLAEPVGSRAGRLQAADRKAPGSSPPALLPNRDGL